MSGAIIGVKVTRGGQESHIRALNGVVLCTGGFEDNKEMVQDYIGLTDYAPTAAYTTPATASKWRRPSALICGTCMFMKAASA